MIELARSDSAFIRPVPSSGHSRRLHWCTRELILLCEAAGYDVVIVETVYAGQSETEVSPVTASFTADRRRR